MKPCLQAPLIWKRYSKTVPRDLSEGFFFFSLMGPLATAPQKIKKGCHFLLRRRTTKPKNQNSLLVFKFSVRRHARRSRLYIGLHLLKSKVLLQEARGVRSGGCVWRWRGAPFVIYNFLFLSPRSRKDDDFTVELAIFLSDLSGISSWDWVDFDNHFLPRSQTSELQLQRCNWTL